MKIKICKKRLTEYKGQRFIEVKMTFLGFLLRNSWQVSNMDFNSDYMDKWVPCYANIGYLLSTR